jgi:hypothetical protein
VPAAGGLLGRHSNRELNSAVEVEAIIGSRERLHVNGAARDPRGLLVVHDLSGAMLIRLVVRAKGGSLVVAAAWAGSG